MIGLVWAQARDRVIGADGAVPFDLPEDRARFAALTRGAVVVMGRATWESLPPRYRPLPGRRTVVLTGQDGWGAPGAEVARSLGQALAVGPGPGTGDVWVVGGARPYAEAMGRADVLEVTDVDLAVRGDTLAPGIGPSWRADERDGDGWLTSTTGLRYRFSTYRRHVGAARRRGPRPR